MSKANPWPERMQANRQHAAVVTRRPAVVAPAARPAAVVAAPPPITKTSSQPSPLARKTMQKARPLTRLERFDLDQQQRRQRKEAITAAQAAAAARPGIVVPSTAPQFTALDLAQAGQKERDRIRGILDAPEAVGREGYARSYAFDTGLDVGSVRHALAKIHVETEDDRVDAAVKQILGFQRRPLADHDEIDQRALRIATAGGRQLSETTS